MKTETIVSYAVLATFASGCFFQFQWPYVGLAMAFIALILWLIAAGKENAL